MASTTHDEAHAAPLTWLTRRQVCAWLQVKERTLFNWLRAGTFPQPYAISSRCQRWHRGQIESFMEQRQAR